ncbi:DUF4179 domain-containing protein [Paenibacillus chibensis]|uniref:DUF4179 domain-containing protein n=1 Tax=Paenibacillus chibensis TaxID=59846 RepID=UPI000FD6F124|nr:DUF4179 domain-containing protein [Paenibacillus chibensis]MEC0368487.1 DUF4179 domain-containing protein [Paenibacillus chibensis]
MSRINLDTEIQWEKERIEEGGVGMPALIRSRLDDFYAQVEEGSIPVRSDQFLPRHGMSIKQGAIVAAAAAVFIGVTIVASAFVSPGMAEALKQVPFMGSVFKLAGDLGLQTADEKGLVATLNSSDVHNGVKLRITQAVYDGTRLALALEREGADGQTPPLHSVNVNDQKPGEGDLLKSLDVVINGKSALASQAQGTSILTWGPGKDEQSVIVQYAGSLIDEAQSKPGPLQIRVEASLNGMEDTFKLNSVVKKTAEAPTVLTPGIEKTDGFVRFSVDRIEMTPVTMIMATTLTQSASTEDLPARFRSGTLVTDQATGKPKSRVYLRPIYYDVADDQGNTVNLVSGSGQTGSTTIPARMQVLFTPFTGTPKAITIKPYYLKTDADGKPELDSDGNWHKDYVPELEMVIPVPAQAH